MSIFDRGTPEPRALPYIDLDPHASLHTVTFALG